MDAPCGGRGRCGKCRLLIQEGDAPVNAEERQFFTEEELDEGWRLACMQTVQGNLTLRLPPLGTVFLEAAPAEKQKDASGGVRQ